MESVLTKMLAAATLFSACTYNNPSPERPAASAIDIHESTLRFLFEFNGSVQKQSVDFYCIGATNFLGTAIEDPSEILLERFTLHTPAVVKYSECSVGILDKSKVEEFKEAPFLNEGLLHKSTGKRAIAFTVNEVKRSGEEAIVTASFFEKPNSSIVAKYYLRRMSKPPFTWLVYDYEVVLLM